MNKSQSRALKKFVRIQATFGKQPVKAQIKEWKKRTGMTHVTFYRYKALAEAQAKKVPKTAQKRAYNRKIARPQDQKTDYSKTILGIVYILMALAGLYVNATFFGMIGIFLFVIFFTMASVVAYNLKNTTPTRG